MIMCGRYTLLAEEVDILQRFSIEQPIENYQPSYNIAPGQDVLVIIHDGEEKRAGHLRWGLVPYWANDEKSGNKMINARDSCYEWQKTGNGNQPKRIQLKDQQLFAFAGLWDKWEKGDKKLFTCTMLTRDANSFMKDIHHRMPIILPKDQEDQWIAPYFVHPEKAQRFLQSLETDELTAYDVTRHVNSVRNNDEKCIAPIVGS